MTMEQEQEIVRLHGEGVSTTHIARKIGVSRNTISERLAGVKKKPGEPAITTVGAVMDSIDDKFKQIDSQFSVLEQMCRNREYGYIIRNVAGRHGFVFADGSEIAASVDAIRRIRTQTGSGVDSRNAGELFAALSILMKHIAENPALFHDRGNRAGSAGGLITAVEGICTLSGAIRSGRHSVLELKEASSILEDCDKYSIDRGSLVWAAWLLRTSKEKGFDIAGFIGNTDVNQKIEELRDLDADIGKKRYELSRLRAEIASTETVLRNVSSRLFKAGEVIHLEDRKQELSLEYAALMKKVSELNKVKQEMASLVSEIALKYILPVIHRDYFSEDRDHGFQDPILALCAKESIRLMVNWLIENPWILKEKLSRNP